MSDLHLHRFAGSLSATGIRSAAVMAAVMAACCCFQTGSVKAQDAANQPGSQPRPVATAAGDADEAVATFAGGCFWCTEAVFENMIGVNDVVSGYIGGNVPNPTYKQVCGKQTGHAEAVEIYYDPQQVTYAELLKVFFKTHDPTTPNRQGADEGPQYRSSIFIHDAEQEAIANKVMEELAGEFKNPIVTKLEKATEFYPAEEYHQDYFRRNPNAGYCQAVVVQKVKKFETQFSDKVKK